MKVYSFSRFLLSIGIVCFLGIFFSYQDAPTVREHILTPSDYKGTPDLSSSFLAETSSGVFYTIRPGKSCSASTMSLNLTSELRILPNSWIKLDEINNDLKLKEVLSHEQGHYDIFSVFNSNLKYATRQRCFDKKKYKAEFDFFYKKMYFHYDSLQKKYDLETQHMENKLKQKEWKQRIANLKTEALLNKFD